MCALADSIRVLIAGRVVQGASGGGIVVLVNVVVSDLFSMRWVQSALVTKWDTDLTIIGNVALCSASAVSFGPLL